MAVLSHSKNVTGFPGRCAASEPQNGFHSGKIRQACLSRIARPNVDDEPCKTAHCFLLRRHKVKNNVSKTYGFKRPHDNGSANSAVEASNMKRVCLAVLLMANTVLLAQTQTPEFGAWIPVSFDAIASVRLVGQYTLTGLNVEAPISTTP
jgi:hypothetical protein